MIIVRQLREELTQALAEHLDRCHREYMRTTLGFDVDTIGKYAEAVNVAHARRMAEDCMDFMYGEIEELYPDQPSCDGQSEESAPVPDHQE